MRRSMSGITLLELLVTLAIAAILIGLAVPSMVSFTKSKRNLAVQDNLTASFSYTRSEALTRGEPVAICASDDNDTCTGTWADGWIVFQDDNADGARQSSEELIRVHQDDAEVTIAEASSLTVLRFNATGLPSSIANFAICDPDGEVDPKGLAISAVGRAGTVDSGSVTCP